MSTIAELIGAARSENVRALVVALLFSATLSAQEFRGTILGQVTDLSRAAVPGAAIVVTNVDTNTAAKTNSNETGRTCCRAITP